ncbi:MAG: trans-anhydromevalonate 5-phosphate decarboxylase [Thermoproteota archaeon]|nr:trans-anhydromevalonate 5-phosphate decarboxylase [Thermoproteota archaeon]
MSDLRSFLSNLEASGDLIRIKEEVSPKYEIPTILKEFDGRKAVFFEKVEGHSTQIVGGVCGTRDRIYRALDCTRESFYQRLGDALSHPKVAKRVNEGLVKEIIEKPKLTSLPVLTHYEHDAGPYITSAILSARSSDGSFENVSVHRLLVLDDNHLCIRIVPRHLYRLCQLAKEGGKTLDVSISIGFHPAVLVAASSPASFGTSEFDVANTLMNNQLNLVKCEHIEAYAPADAEVVLEGKILLDKEVLEGPFPDLTSTYDIQRKQPIIEVIGVMRRREYLYQALLPGESEHRLLMGMPQEVRIWDYARNVVPTVKAVNMTLGGCGWLHCVVGFDKFREGDGKNILMSVFAANPSIKHAIVVDSDIDVYDMEQVEWAIATRFRGDQGLLVVPNVRVSSLDPASNQELELGCKVGVDATKTLLKPKEKFEKAKIPMSLNVTKILKKYKLS